MTRILNCDSQTEGYPAGACAGAQVLGADKDEWSQTRQQIGASIDICMGGRVAEELVFGADQVLCSRPLQP